MQGRPLYSELVAMHLENLEAFLLVFMWEFGVCGHVLVNLLF